MRQPNADNGKGDENMSNIAIVTDSNSGILQSEAKELGIFVLPMPFFIDEKLHREEIDLSQEAFYQILSENGDVSTSQPSPADITDLWDEVLKSYDEIVHIPMSSGLSGSCQTAMMLADDYDGRVHVVDNQRISVTQKLAVFDAVNMVKAGMSAAQIKEKLTEEKLIASIYIMVDTLKYLKKGGRITPAAAMLGTVLKLKPVLTIQGEKLDAYAKVRGQKQAKKTMIEAMKKDMEERFAEERKAGLMELAVAHTNNFAEAESFKAELQNVFPDVPLRFVDPLSLSVSCHIGPGALAVACAKRSQK